jgi:dihydropteroate synthase
MNSKDNFFSPKQMMNLNGTLVDLSTPKVMGILNITPDSFFDGGKYLLEKEILNQCEKMLYEGAFIVDIGAYSSRPGAVNISESEEYSRLTTALKIIRKQFPSAYLSVDTFRSEIASKVVKEFGVNIINDISGGTLDPKMFEVIAGLKVPFVIMHMRGTPETMLQHTEYANIINEMLLYFAQKIELAKQYGISDVIIDPGFGFSKTTDQNFYLLANLNHFKILEKPILAGLSRKSMIFKTLNTSPDGALAGTITANTISLINGASFLRVHDVKEAMDSIAIFQAYQHQIN